MSKAIFLDRDGVLNVRPSGYVTSAEDFIPMFGIVPFLYAAIDAGWLLIVITNQQGVGKGLMTEGDLEHVHQTLRTAFAAKGISFSAIYTCTDLASMQSFRRKPNPGMLLEAATDFDIELASSWIVGDSVTDAQAGQAAGCYTILVGNHEAALADIVVPSTSNIPIEIL